MHGRLGNDNGGPRDALHQVCVGFVVVVLVGEGVCIGLPCCVVVAGVGRFEGSFEEGTKFFFEVLPLAQQITVPQY